MMSKKTIQMKIQLGVIFTLFTLLFSLFSCNNPFEPPNLKSPETGKGYFSLSIDGVSTAKTIMPFGADDFAGFTVEFENVDKSELSFTLEDLTYETLSTPVLLDGGIWNVYVSAYLEIEGELTLAAQGELKVVIGVGETIARSVALNPLTDGEGVFSWDIEYPDEVSTAIMTITPMIANGMDEQVLYFIGGTPLIGKTDTLTLNSGYYRVMFRLQIGNTYAERREILHVYDDMESTFEFDFNDVVFYSNVLLVSTEADSGAGSLRQAITNIPTGGRIIVNPDVKTIALTARLDITKSMTIEGNGVTITRDASWTTVDSNSQLMYIDVRTTDLTIRRVWFKDGRANSGGAIRINAGTLNLESCIFSGNKATNGSGGAIYNNEGTLNVKSSTFYNNSGASSSGGAIEAYGLGISKMTFTGNLFYGNTANNSPSAVGGLSYGITSGGYNVADLAVADFTKTGDKTISVIPISGVSFRLLSGSGAANVIDIIPEDYPAEDFYGDPIADGAAAGAVQRSAADGYYLGLAVNNNAAGEISVDPASDADGIVSSNTVTITATLYDTNRLNCWLVNGERHPTTENPLELTLTGHTLVQAVIERVFIVTNFSDADGSASVAGTLRHAVTTAIDGDFISLSGVTAGQTVIELRSSLSVTKSLIIEGNGVTLTPATTWTASNVTPLVFINDSENLTIRQIWFKDGRATGSGGAINIRGGTVTLESCIFSGNDCGTGSGGAILKEGSTTLNVKGCTFYNNSTLSIGGAISVRAGALYLAGNLFYGNIGTDSGPVIYSAGYRNTSDGYNVADKTLVMGSGSFTPHASDLTVSAMTISGVTFRLLSGSPAANIITTLPENYPTVDFYGDPIPTTNAAAGAVQSTVSGSGYYLGLSLNNSAAGTVTSPQRNGDGIATTNAVTVTATRSSSAYAFKHWLVNGEIHTSTTNPLAITLTEHTTVQAVFERAFFVTNFSDATGSATVEGTLRYALTNAEDGDIIRLDKETAGQTVIQLTSRLPNITKSIIIEGNGVTLTRAASWTSVNDGSQLMYISGPTAVVTVSRLHFKDGRATYYGALDIVTGDVTLESCVFSGNRTSNRRAGAISKRGTGILDVKGCTFYNNSTVDTGGAIFNAGGTLTLSGNLFYGNTAAAGGPVVYQNSGTVTSGGFNVADAALVTESSGVVAPHANDKTISAMPVSGVNFRLLSGSPAANVITALPTDYPVKDFYGDDITAGAAAGAVQGMESGSGYYLRLSSNNSAAGSVSAVPAPDSDTSLVSAGSVTITATSASGYGLAYWIVDGSKDFSTSPLTLTVNSHTTVQAVFARIVTDFGDTNTSGTLRYAMTNVQAGDLIYLSGVTAGQTVIELTSRLPTITRDMTIEGNGVTITRAATWTTIDDNSQLMYFDAGISTIRRVWFKDGRATNYGAAIHMNNGTLTLESCIFSGNRNSSNSSSYGGGAIYMNFASLTVKSSTFYDNSSGSRGGAIYAQGTSSGTWLNLSGNLFYGNTALTGPVVYRSSSSITITSYGYNVADATLVVGTYDSNANDTTISVLPVSGLNFKLLSESGAANVITTWPVAYPTVDFYGAAIPTSNAAAGAVQSTVSGNGSYLGLSVSNRARGSVNVTSPQPNADGLYSGTVEITATVETGYSVRWLVDGTDAGSNNPLQLTLTAHTNVQAIFFKEFVVDDFSDATGSATEEGTLRHAMTNAQDYDVIHLDKETAGATVIELTARLPDITRNITIEGNGVTITRASTWTTTSNASQLMRTNGGTSTISRIWFKDGRATAGGAAINAPTGTLTLESCIFSGNRTSDSNGNGGAIVKAGTGTLNVKGCTFYDNSAYQGGAIYVNGGTLTLTGNLFYGNTATVGPVVYRYDGTVTSNGYNVVNVALGTTTAQSGFSNTNDKTIAAILGDNATTPFTNTTTLAPKSELSSATYGIPAATWTVGTGATAITASMPSTDFYGETRTWPGAPGAVR